MEELPQWETTVQKAVVKLRTVLVQLDKIWEEIGFTEETRSMYCEQAFGHIEDLLNDMVSESEAKKQTLLKNVEESLEKIRAMSKELGMDVVTDGYEQLPLKELERVLEQDLHRLQYCKEQRITHLKELLAQEKIICKVLGSVPLGINKYLPSEDELNSFKIYLEKQEAEKNRLESIFKDMRWTIIKMMDDLGVKPSLNFERLVYNDPDNFILSSNNMAKLRELRDQLKVQAEEAKQHVEEMKQELIALWKYLDEPEHTCESFLNSCVGYNIATINTLSAEVKRCKDKRRQNIASCVTQIRTELEKLWDLCKYSDEQRQQFVHFNSQMYTEDLLTLHELEVEKLQKFYATHKSIFEQLEQRENLWKKMKELVQRANNPDRFYNRGGQLLIEEKERKTIQKKLPKIEEQLRCLIREYETANGEAFTVNGVTIDELLKESWEVFSEEKETIRKARKEAKDKSVKKTTLNVSKRTPLNSSKKAPLSSSKKLLGVLSTRRPTPLSSSKRKLLFSPSPNNSAKRRNLANESQSKRSTKVSRRLSQSKRKGIKCGQKENVSHSSAAADTTYNQFKDHLKNKEELCSSLLPEQILINATTSKTKSLIRTPAKPLRKNLPMTPNGTPKLSHSQSTHRTPRSPKLVQSTRLATVSTPLPIIF